MRLVFFMLTAGPVITWLLTEVVGKAWKSANKMLLAIAAGVVTMVGAKLSGKVPVGLTTALVCGAALPVITQVGHDKLVKPLAEMVKGFFRKNKVVVSVEPKVVEGSKEGQ